jgi:hypothetical protein
MENKIEAGFVKWSPAKENLHKMFHRDVAFRMYQRVPITGWQNIQKSGMGETMITNDQKRSCYILHQGRSNIFHGLREVFHIKFRFKNRKRFSWVHGPYLDGQLGCAFKGNHSSHNKHISSNFWIQQMNKALKQIEEQRRDNSQLSA